MLMHLKRGRIRCGCTKQLNLYCIGLGWVRQLMGWVGNGPMDNSDPYAKP